MGDRNSTSCSGDVIDQNNPSQKCGLQLLGEAERKTPVRAEPHPTRSFALLPALSGVFLPPRQSGDASLTKKGAGRWPAPSG
jgi:hypothetical protein